MDAIIISIVGWIITILIAVYAARSGSKDTAKKLAALEESTTKQVESIKELAKIQAKIAALQLEKEAWEARHRVRQLSEESFNALENEHRMIGVPMNEYTSMMRQKWEKEDHLSLEKDFYSKQVSLLDSYTKRIKEIMNDIDKG